MSESAAAAPEEPENHAELLKRISREMTAAQKREFGKGPVSTRSYLYDDLLMVVMRDGLTIAEHSMVRHGRAEAVRSFREAFQD